MRFISLYLWAKLQLVGSSYSPSLRIKPWSRSWSRGCWKVEGHFPPWPLSVSAHALCAGYLHSVTTFSLRESQFPPWAHSAPLPPTPSCPIPSQVSCGSANTVLLPCFRVPLEHMLCVEMLVGGSSCCPNQTECPYLEGNYCPVLAHYLFLSGPCLPQTAHYVVRIIKSPLHQAGLSSAPRALRVHGAAKEDEAHNDAVITCRLHNAQHHLFVPNKLFQQLSDANEMFQLLKQPAPCANPGTHRGNGHKYS